VNKPVVGAETKFSAEDMMLKTASCLVSDLQDCLGDPGEFYLFQGALRTLNITRIRESIPTQAENEDDSYRFKAIYQIQNLLKRYRFQQDTFSEDELIAKACKGFLATQSRLALLKERPRNSFYEAVLDTASDYIHKVLGVYDANEHQNACRFGNGASVGVRSRLACEAARWEWPISGSQEQTKWFSDFVVESPHIMRYWYERMNARGENDLTSQPYNVVDSLTMTLVPKSFKALRSIVPNTTIGSFITDGLGRMIQRRLKRNGYDITQLQMEHRARACQASIHKMDVTLDLSAASDSLSVSLMERLLPHDWYTEMCASRIGVVVLPDGSSCEMETFCTMGIGFTFPLQTLVFLGLLKATEKWTDSFRKRNWAHITVYGDDMIFDRGILHNVKLLFSYTGLVINLDKSFDEGPFRESCGGDFHHGLDVRPFQPESGDAHVGKSAYEALLYKFINGFRRRWTEQEIPRTLNYLVTQLGNLGMEIKLVPSNYPDVAGVQCSAYRNLPAFLEGSRCARPKVVGNGVIRFSYLRLTPEEAKEERHDPYYWVALGGKSSTTDSQCFDITNKSLPQKSTSRSATALIIERLCGCEGENGGLLSESFRKVILGQHPRFLGPPQQVRVDLATYVPVRHSGSYTRHLGSTCFWDP